MKFILGPPCAGKGTIAKNLGYKTISAGNILREMCEDPQYSHLKDTLNNGNLVATDLICEILIEKSKEYNYDVFIDGFPRTVDQAIMIKDFLYKNNINCEGVYYIYAPFDILLHRTNNRFYCPICFNTEMSQIECCKKLMIKRDDDTTEVLTKRLNIFNDNILNVMEILEGPTFFIKNDNDISNAINKIKYFINKYH